MSGKVVDRKDERILIIDSPKSKGASLGRNTFLLGLQWLFLETLEC